MQRPERLCITLLWGYRDDTWSTTLKWSKTIPRFLLKWYIGYWRKRGEGRQEGRERERGRKAQAHSQHIFSSLPERGSRSLNYWLPSQANIPACQPWFLLSFAPTPSDGAHFVLTRNRRRCENCDTWSCVRETGSALEACERLQMLPLLSAGRHPSWVSVGRVRGARQR